MGYFLFLGMEDISFSFFSDFSLYQG